MAIKAWFLRADDELWEKVIQAFEGPHAHMEIQFSDGLFFTSTTDEGPRFTTFDKTCDPRPEMWDVVELPITEPDEAIVRALAEMICIGIDGKDQHYGWDHIIGGFLPLPLDQNSPDTWICSQSCVYVLQAIGLFMGLMAQRVSPHDAFIYLSKYTEAWRQLRFEVTG